MPCFALTIISFDIRIRQTMASANQELFLNCGFQPHLIYSTFSLPNPCLFRRVQSSHNHTLPQVHDLCSHLQFHWGQARQSSAVQSLWQWDQVPPIVYCQWLKTMVPKCAIEDH